MKSIRGASALLLAFALISSAVVGVASPMAASPAEEYSGTHFGANNIDPRCEDDARVGTLTLVALDTEGTTQDPDSFANVCHHMRADMSALDSPQIDVLILVPASPVAERDMRIMRQSIEMWEGGIDYLAEQMGLFWLQDGVDFHITVQYIDPVTGETQGFSPHPVVDPEIVVIAAMNPAFVTFGIGIDPVNTSGQVFGTTQEGPCLPVANPFDLEEWNEVPGFDNHHGASGTYEEDCNGESETGGNVCFAINTTTDPLPDVTEIGNLFDLVSHEVGHCLTVGHVGDGAEGWWGLRPTNDIMAYNSDPPGLNKCVSTLNVEGFAVRMSNYLDVNGDGAVDNADRLTTNDTVGQGGNPFQIQHPDDHLYASSTGDPTDCPQADLGPIPGPRVDWTPQPVSTVDPVRSPLLKISAPADGAESEDGEFDVIGTVRRAADGEPTEPSAFFDDADDDATTPLTEILDLDVDVTATHLEATMRLEEIPPPSDGASPTSYSLTVDGRKFDSFTYGIGFVQPRTFDNGTEMPEGTTTWDPAAKTAKFHLPLSYLAAAGITAPYQVRSSASLGNAILAARVDDSAPEAGNTLGLAEASLGVPSVLGQTETKTFQDDLSNTFFPFESTAPFRLTIEEDFLGATRTFPMVLDGTNDVRFELGWVNRQVGGNDLDLYVTGGTPPQPGSDINGATAQDNPEVIELKGVSGSLTVGVEPWLVTEPLGLVYSLTATITPTGGTEEESDTDGDGVLDAVDACPSVAGTGPDGCPPPTDADGDGFPDGTDVCPEVPGVAPSGCPARPAEEVQLWVGGAVAASDPVDTAGGVDRFVLPVALAEGTHEVTVKWVDATGVEHGRASLTLIRTPDEVVPPPNTGGGTGGGGGGTTTTPSTGGGGSTAPAPVDRPAAGTRPPGATSAPEPAPEPSEAILTRVHGGDRIDTSVAASLAAFNDRAAEVAVLARADRFADGLAGTSLAVAYGGPLLLTPGSGLDARVADELRRVLPEGNTVWVLGGPAALPLEIDAQLKNMGYVVTRVAGKDRFETAALVARAQPRHETILVATGQEFADALAAGAAAAEARGTVVLTDNGALPKSTADYLADHPGAEVFAIGGPAAAALPKAHHVVGLDRFDTSVKVAAMFFSTPQIVGLASGVSFPDALSGGPLLGRFSGPLVLTAPTELSVAVREYLSSRRSSVDDLFVIGGENAVARPVVDDALQALRGR